MDMEKWKWALCCRRKSRKAELEVTWVSRPECDAVGL